MHYAIHARSTQAGQTQREFGQDELEGRPITNRQRAEQTAAAFAERLNKRRFLGKTDWQGEVELVNNTHIYSKL